MTQERPQNRTPFRGPGFGLQKDPKMFLFLVGTAGTKGHFVGWGDGSTFPPSLEPTERPVAGWMPFLEVQCWNVETARPQIPSNQPGSKRWLQIKKEIPRSSCPPHGCMGECNCTHVHRQENTSIMLWLLVVFCTPSHVRPKPSCFLGYHPFSSWTEFPQLENTDLKLQMSPTATWESWSIVLMTHWPEYICKPLIFTEFLN